VLLLALAAAGLVGLGVAGEGLLRHRPATAWLAWGVFYIGIPVTSLVWLRGLPEGGRAALIWLFLVIWATDIGAYAAGRSIGGPLLAPRVSPKKTWAGLIGGMISAAVVGAVAARLLGHPSMLPLAAFSGMMAVVAQIGDLGESWVKRRFGVKDSSNVIPGHGGVFDRVDGLIAAAPVVALAAWAAGEGWLAWK
ncbi:MAG: phosphatidate cytidylyltransferase, partial [Alphaproteobacteria bacterium]|nr:phosphatidate cytidylyltransferase [Alphaproteobacteria bacterium]